MFFFSLEIHLYGPSSVDQSRFSRELEGQAYAAGTAHVQVHWFGTKNNFSLETFENVGKFGRICTVLAVVVPAQDVRGAPAPLLSRDKSVLKKTNTC